MCVRPHVGISHRDKHYDAYINGNECLTGPNASFLLTHYTHLLRTDMDTFPTPPMLGKWPDGVIARVLDGGYSFKNSSGMSGITEANKAAAAALGLNHHGWHDLGTTWFGPAHKIVNQCRSVL